MLFTGHKSRVALPQHATIPGGAAGPPRPPGGSGIRRRAPAGSSGFVSGLTGGLVTVLISGLTGCAGSGAGLDANGQPIGSGGGPVPLTADFASIQANVFTPICTRCHAGASAPEGLQLDADHSYALLVGVASQEVPTLMRVKAGDPDNSYIIKKLEGASGIVGVRMPYGGPYLDQATINVIRQWITNGAQKAAAVAPSASSKAQLAPGRLEAAISAAANTPSSSLPAAATAVSPFAIIATSPLRDAIVTAPVHQIAVAFSQEVDLSLANSATISVRSLDAAQEIPVAIRAAHGNPATLLITPATPLGAGTYQVTLHGSGTGGAALADVNAEALGGDESFVFTVDITP